MIVFVLVVRWRRVFLLLGFGQGDEDGGPEDGGQDHVEPAVLARKIASLRNFIACFTLFRRVFIDIVIYAELVHGLGVIDVKKSVMAIYFA